MSKILKYTNSKVDKALGKLMDKVKTGKDVDCKSIMKKLSNASKL